jgi:hypothetical protein
MPVVAQTLQQPLALTRPVAAKAASAENTGVVAPQGHPRFEALATLEMGRMAKAC